MQSILVYTMLFSWPLVASWLFSNLKLERAVILAVLLPFMILPLGSGINLPVLPVLDKKTIPNIALLFLLIQYSGRKFRILPLDMIAAILFMLMLWGPFITTATNTDPLIFPQKFIPGMSIKEAINGLIFAFIIVVPFIAGRLWLGTAEAHRMLLQILVVAGLIYSVPMLIEIRLSPQLHTWIYGYFPHSGGFIQQMRAGGFRPIVFMGHGLTVAFFIMIVTVAAAALWRDELVKGGRYLLKAGYLFVLLVLCKTAAALLYGMFLLFMVMLCSRRLQFLAAVAMVLTSVAYPALRGAELIPVDEILETARSYSEERAQSLETRFRNEGNLLERAEERPLFGWGSWGRNHILDPITGAITSITDGHWIIIIGTYGWVGYLATFGLLAWPVLAIAMRWRREGAHILTPPTIALCLILGVNMIDLLPNSTITPITWLIVGSLLGYAEQRSRPGEQSVEEIQSTGTETPKRARTIL